MKMILQCFLINLEVRNIYGFIKLYNSFLIIVSEEGPPTLEIIFLRSTFNIIYEE